MSTHTPGRLSLFIGQRGKVLSICFGDKPNGATPCVVNWPGFESSGLPVRKNEANARRLVAAWNACEGIDTETLETTGGAAVGWARTASKLLHATKQRDDLLAALKLLLASEPLISAATDAELESGLDDEDEKVRVQANAWLVARAAIQKVEGK